MDYTTAIVIMAPPPVQRFAVPLMRRYPHDDLLRVPAHITVLFPFVPTTELDAVCRTLRTLFADVPPFNVTLKGYGHFPTAVFLQPVDPQPIQALFHKVHAAFPAYAPYRGEHGNDNIMPHMTVGVFNSAAEREQAVYPPYEPITFRVRCLHLIAGVEREPIPWVTYDVIPLGGAS